MIIIELKLKNYCIFFLPFSILCQICLKHLFWKKFYSRNMQNKLFEKRFVKNQHSFCDRMTYICIYIYNMIFYKIKFQKNKISSY